jgi:2-oxoglutarate dehydrogenase E2 component (dihydrolipoamide succinyltransferase)
VQHVAEGADSEVLPWRRRRARDTAGFVSPRVRQLLAEQGLTADEVAGTGRDGRVSASDVLAARAADVRIPFNRIRQRSAPALLASKHTSAHALVSAMCDYSAVEAVRAAVKEEWRRREGFSLTYLPFVARAVVDALAEHPSLNASVGANELVVHRGVNLSIAVDLDHEGLVVPVIPAADTLRLVGIARSIVDLAGRARARRLVPDDLAGGTFTITNPGAYGTYVSVPIINQPQVAILSTDGVRKRVVASDGADGQPGVTVRPIGHLCLSFDHRAIDGAPAGAFLRRVVEILETRDWRAEL